MTIRTTARRIRTAIRVLRGVPVNEPPMFINFVTPGNTVYGAQVIEIEHFCGMWNFKVEHAYIASDGKERSTTAWVAASQLLN